jgi:hypothetical protein
MKWDNLTMSQKQALMKIYVNNGVTNLDEIVNHYNRYAEGGPKEVTEPPINTVMYSRTHRELVGNVVNTRPVPGLVTMTEVPRVGAGINMPITEAINNMITRRSRVNTPTNVVSTDSIVARRPVSYIGMPTRVNRFDEGGSSQNFLLGENPLNLPTLEDIEASALSRIGNGLPSNNQSLYDAAINKVNNNIRDVQNLGPAVQQAAEAQRQEKLDDLYNAKLMGKSLSTAASIMGVSSALSPLSNITVTNTDQATDALASMVGNSTKGLVREIGKFYSSVKPFL